MSNIEPISGTPLRGKGSVVDFNKPEEHAAAIVIFQQAYFLRSAEQSISELAKLLLDSGHFQYIFVEGARGLIDTSYARQFGATLAQWIDRGAQVSPGILELLDELRSDVKVWGVDDMEQRAEHHFVQRQCTKFVKQWQHLAANFREALAEAKQTVQYTEPMLWLSQNFFGDRGDLSFGEKVTRLLELGATVNLEGALYPLMTKVNQINATEKLLDSEKFEKEQEALLKHLFTALQPYKHYTTLDLPSALPLIRVWLDKTQQSEADLESEVSTHGITTVLRRCQEWFLSFLADRKRKVDEGVVTQYELFSEILTLGLMLNIDISRFDELLRHYRVLEDTSALSRSLVLRESQSYTEGLMDRLISTPEQREVHDLDKALSLLEKAGAMELIPDEWDSLSEEMTWPVLQERMMPFSKRVMKIKLPRKIDAMTRTAFQFCHISAQRSRFMTEETVRQLSRHGGTGAILVCGGYHTYAITKLLNARYQDIAWSNILPEMDADDLKGGKRKHD